MTDEAVNTGEAQAAADDNSIHLVIQRIYAKDMSFEAPNLPQLFLEEYKPEIQVSLQSRARSVAEEVYEVVMKVTVTAKSGEQTAFIAEVDYAGLFGLRCNDEAEKQKVLGAYCPNVLYPYAREAVSEMAARGGFPQVLLAPVNFDKLYADSQANQQTEGQAQEQAPVSDDGIKFEQAPQV